MDTLGRQAVGAGMNLVQGLVLTINIPVHPDSPNGTRRYQSFLYGPSVPCVDSPQDVADPIKVFVQLGIKCRLLLLLLLFSKGTRGYLISRELPWTSRGDAVTSSPLY